MNKSAVALNIILFCLLIAQPGVIMAAEPSSNDRMKSTFDSVDSILYGQKKTAPPTPPPSTYEPAQQALPSSSSQQALPAADTPARPQKSAISQDKKPIKAEPKKQNTSPFKDPVTGMEFVFVKGGCFQMGDVMGDGHILLHGDSAADRPGENEKPVHEVCLDDFYIGKYEVTQGQWKKIMANNPSYIQSCGDNCPVEQVSWVDVQNFISKINKQTNKSYRLPTEAEWEYACRSGGKKMRYCGSDNVDSVAWYLMNSDQMSHPVGQKQPNDLGLYDMSGNVYEWVYDLYGRYTADSVRNPKGSSEPSMRVFRGGGFNSGPFELRPSTRSSNHDIHTNGGLGFRLVLPARQ